MPASRTITYGFGSWVSGYTSLTTFSWWPQDPTTLNPAYDPTKLITNDLSKNLQAVRNGQITIGQIQLDDPPANGGETKVGPTFPGGSMINACWMEKLHYDALTTNKPPRIPAGMQCRDYELTTVWYWGGTLANRRFWGFYGEITAEQGSSGLVSIWPAGKSQVAGQQPAGSWWINFTTQVHPIEPGFTAIGTGLTAAKQGALFLDATTRSSLGLSGPKLPPAAGSNITPRVR